MPFLFLSLLLWLVAILGIGLWGQEMRIFRCAAGVRRFSLSETLFIGLYSVALIVLVYHFFFSINGFLTGALLLLGWVGLVLNRRLLLEKLNRANSIFFLFVVGGISVVAPAAFYNIDTGYYHLPSVVLRREFPLLLGVANLFGPYGHNSIWFLIEAAIGLPLLGWASTFSLNSIFAIFFLTYLYEKHSTTNVNGFVFIIVSVLLLNQNLIGVGGLSPDFPSFVCGSSILLLALSAGPESKTSGKELSLLFASFAMGVKSSNVLVLFPVLFLFYKKSQEKLDYRIVWLAGGLLVLWLSGNILSSGCLLFPQPGTCFSKLPWAMPESWVKGWLIDVKYHLCGVREGGSIFAQKDCLAHWGQRFLREPLLRYGSVMIAGSFLLRLVFQRREKVAHRKPNVLHFGEMFFCCLLPLVVWLVVAPNVRFASWIFLALIAYFVILIMPRIEIDTHQRKKLFLTALSLGFVLTLRTAVATHPGKIDWLHWPQVPVPSVLVKKEKQELKVVGPIDGFQCWATRPPCTPDLKPVEIKKWRGRIMITPLPQVKE